MGYSYIDFISCKNSLFLPKGDINKVNTVFFEKKCCILGNCISSIKESIARAKFVKPFLNAVYTKAGS